MLASYDTSIPFHDEGLARASDVGSRAHYAIAALAARTLQPTLREQERTVAGLLHGFRPIEARAHRQNLRAAVASYFTHLALPDGWVFYGTENRLGTGRVDLLWRNQAGQILLDEIKTGHPRTLTLTRTRDQVERYITHALQIWGDRFLGARLLSTHDPATSRFINTRLEAVPLHTTSYRK